MPAGDHDESNESTAHIDFDGGGFGFGLVPRLGLLCSGFLDSGGSREAVLERIGKNDVALLEYENNQHQYFPREIGFTRRSLPTVFSLFDHDQ